MDPILYTDSIRDLARRWVRTSRQAGMAHQHSQRREELYAECRAVSDELDARVGVELGIKAKVEALGAKYDLATHTFLE